MNSPTLITLDAADYNAKEHDELQITEAMVKSAPIGRVWTVNMPGNTIKDCVAQEAFRLAAIEEGERYVFTLDQTAYNRQGEEEIERFQYVYDAQTKRFAEVPVEERYSLEYEQDNTVIKLESQSYTDSHLSHVVLVTHDDLANAPMGKEFTAQADTGSDRFVVTVEGRNALGDKVELTEERIAGTDNSNGLSSIRDYDYNLKTLSLEPAINTELTIDSPMETLVVDHTMSSAKSSGKRRA